jgi:predicted dehydrogenase
MKAAIVGAGVIAQQHIKGLRKAGCEHIVICDKSPVIAEATAARFGLQDWYVDYESMLQSTKPEVVHVTTPPDSHVPLAQVALEAGSHVLVEKPIAPSYSQWIQLRQFAEPRDRWLLEDQNYIFNRPIQRVLELIASGDFGDAIHVDVICCLAIARQDSIFADTNSEHPAHRLAGGPIGDFLPHLASLAWVFLGPHRTVRTKWFKHESQSRLMFDEMRAFVDTDRGTATLGFSANSQPDGFWVRVYGTRMTATINLFEGICWLDHWREGPRPLTPVFNGFTTAWSAGIGALVSMGRKIGAQPGAYEGLWELIRRFYDGLEHGGTPPVSMNQIDQVQCLVADLGSPDYRI